MRGKAVFKKIIFFIVVIPFGVYAFIDFISTIPGLYAQQHWSGILVSYGKILGVYALFGVFYGVVFGIRNRVHYTIYIVSLLLFLILFSLKGV